ncbi:hypothetical protein PG326_05515 [Riemerella anatipestifer]|nr:hypothetical protein [Riemerella anatipestifer]MDY3324851.1 hypothetical protein [Riemerella anatipestifer]MDY3345068.1 hypothetical protein [Riemerella anatipestifer]MDY3353661.1 hypothetical protein [Riemerella anatipestifer]MDY3357785.1 hypothetical protein [Riemerella anatipestifer]
MKKIVSLVVLFSSLVLFIQCDRNNDDLEDVEKIPTSLVNTTWYKYYSGKEYSRYTNGYFDEYGIKSVIQYITFDSDSTFYVDSTIFSDKVEKKSGIVPGSYTYNASTGKVEMKYHQNFMGYELPVDRPKVRGKYLVFRIGIENIEYERY